MKTFDYLVGEIVVFEGEYLSVMKAYEDNGELVYELSDGQVVNSGDCSNMSRMVSEDCLGEVAEMLGEDLSTTEDMIYEMGYSIS